MTPGILAAAGTTSTVAIAVTVVATVVVVALAGVLIRLLQVTRAIGQAAGELAEHSAALLDELGGTLAHASAELDRVDDLVGSAETITATVTSASRAAYLGVASPLIKVLALQRGTSRAAQRWRSRSGDSSGPGLSGRGSSVRGSSGRGPANSGTAERRSSGGGLPGPRSGAGLPGRRSPVGGSGGGFARGGAASGKPASGH